MVRRRQIEGGTIMFIFCSQVVWIVNRIDYHLPVLLLLGGKPCFFFYCSLWKYVNICISPGCSAPSPHISFPNLLPMQETGLLTTLWTRAFGYGTCEACWTVNVTVWAAHMVVRECVWLHSIFFFVPPQRERSFILTLWLSKWQQNVSVLILHLADAISTPTQLLHWRRTDTQTRSTLEHTCKERPRNDCWADALFGGGDGERGWRLIKGDCCDLLVIVASCGQTIASDSKRHKQNAMKFYILVCQHSIASLYHIGNCLAHSCLGRKYYTFTPVIFLFLFFH